MIRTRLFDGVETPLTIYNGKAIINLSFLFYSEDCEDGEVSDEEFTFPNFISAYLRIYNERLGKEIKDLALTKSGNLLLLNVNALDMTFEDNGVYYYEMGYLYSGGYEYVLQYGKLTVI